MKNITGVAVVIAIVTAIVLIIFSSIPLASANAIGRTFDREGGVLKYEGELPSSANAESTSISIYKGEKIKFVNAATRSSVDVTVSGPYKDDGDKKSGCSDYHVEKNKSWDSSGMKTGYFFKVTEKNSVGCWFGIEEQSFELKLEKDKVQEDESFDLELKESNKEGGVMKLTIDEDKFAIMNVNGTKIDEIPIRYDESGFDGYDEHEPVYGIRFENGTLAFDTGELNMNDGKYEILLEDFATEEDADEEIEVEKRYLSVECEEEEVMKGDDIVITIESSFFEKEAKVTVEGIYDKPLNLTLDKDGKERVKISTDSDSIMYGRHKITVEICDTDESVTKYVTVKKGEVDLAEVPEEATIGDIICLNGSSDFGDFAVFVIDDVFMGEAQISDGEFEWDWDTCGEVVGFYEIKVFIVSEHAPFSIGESVRDDWQREEGIDASAGVFLLLPAFSMTVPERIAKGDEVVISGETTGADHVYLIVISYKGKVMFPPGEIAIATPVEDDIWEETIDALDTGSYAVICMNEGRDGESKAIKDGKWVTSGEIKTLELRVAIIEDALSTAGSDDLYKTAYFTVSRPIVHLGVPRTVKIGDELTVNAETNIKDGEKVFVSLSQYLSIIKITSVVVENGSVDAVIYTYGLSPGRYKVTVDISERASDEKEVLLVEEEEITQNESLMMPEVVEEANGSEGEMNESHEDQKIPVNVCDLVIAVIVAIFVLITVRRRC
jgi:hypothetical protein